MNHHGSSQKLCYHLAVIFPEKWYCKQNIDDKLLSVEDWIVSHNNRHNKGWYQRQSRPLWTISFSTWIWWPWSLFRCLILILGQCIKYCTNKFHGVPLWQCNNSSIGLIQICFALPQIRSKPWAGPSCTNSWMYYLTGPCNQGLLAQMILQTIMNIRHIYNCQIMMWFTEVGEPVGSE